MRLPAKISATPAAREAIRRLRAARGQGLMFVQSAGCCAGSVPMCFPAGEFILLIGRPMEKVFDFVADSRNEPSFNPAMTSVELLTPLPIGRGTRFRARMGRAGTQMLVELTEFDRPHRLGSRTASPVMQTSGALTFAADGDGTVMSWDWQVRPKGWMRILGPLFGPLGGRMERRIWTSMKRYLENTAARPVTRPAP